MELELEKPISINDVVFMSVKEVADFLRVKPQTVYQWKASGKLKGHSVDTKLMFAKHEIVEAVMKS